MRWHPAWCVGSAVGCAFQGASQPSSPYRSESRVADPTTPVTRRDVQVIFSDQSGRSPVNLCRHYRGGAATACAGHGRKPCFPLLCSRTTDNRSQRPRQHQCDGERAFMRVGERGAVLNVLFRIGYVMPYMRCAQGVSAAPPLPRVPGRPADSRHGRPARPHLIIPRVDAQILGAGAGGG